MLAPYSVAASGRGRLESSSIPLCFILRMKPSVTLSLLAILLLTAACSSTANKAEQAKLPPPGIEVTEVIGPPELNYPVGRIDVKYDFVIQNNASVPITLRGVHLETVNPGIGDYFVPPQEWRAHNTVASHATETAEVWAHGRAYGRGAREDELVTLRVVAYFDTPDGPFNKSFMVVVGK